MSRPQPPTRTYSLAELARRLSGAQEQDRSLGACSDGAERPRLLASLAQGGEEQGGAAVRACIVEAGKKQARVHERIRLGALTRELWPEEGAQAEGLCRNLRALSERCRQDFMLRATRRAIWVRTDFVRAVVESSRATFLDVGSPAFSAFLEEFLETVGRSFDDEKAFGCWAVECIVCAAVTMHSLRLQVIKPAVENILHKSRTESFNSVLRLYPPKMALSAFIDHVRPLAQGLRKMLQIDCDEEEADVKKLRAASCSTEQSGKIGQDYSCLGGLGNGYHSLCPFLEDALYNWNHRAEEIMAEASLLNAQIEDTMRFLEASMSCTRNRLLRFELWTMIATVAIGLGASVSGVFGMNLDNYGFNEVSGGFYAVTGSILFLMVLSVSVSFYMIARSQRHYNNHAASFGNNRFFRSIGDDDYVLSLCATLPNGTAPRLQNVLGELGEPVLPLANCCRQRTFGSHTAPTSPNSPRQRPLLPFDAGGHEGHH